ncbi:MAG: thioredoxin domain-containing protein, partial [Candidatus Micrarchaeia archaeon]
LLLTDCSTQKPAHERVAINISGKPILGSENASITLVEFADYECPFCISSQPTIKRILGEYNGSVKFAYFHFPVHSSSWLMSEAAECAGEQGKFWDYHEALFSRTPESRNDLIAYARLIGINKSAFASCLSSKRNLAKVQRDFDYGKSIGVMGTPTFFINGRMFFGALEYDEFASIIHEELKYNSSM